MVIYLQSLDLLLYNIAHYNGMSRKKWYYGSFTCNGKSSTVLGEELSESDRRLQECDRPGSEIHCGANTQSEMVLALSSLASMWLFSVTKSQPKEGSTIY